MNWLTYKDKAQEMPSKTLSNYLEDKKSNKIDVYTNTTLREQFA
jgi:hypothetical protein